MKILITIFLITLLITLWLLFPVVDLTGMLPTNGNYPTRELDSIVMVVWHHSGSTTDNAYTIANYHITTKQWKGIGYHYLINRQGQIFQVNNLKSISNHTEDYNPRSIGICLLGDFDVQLPSIWQRLAAIKLQIIIAFKLKHKYSQYRHGELNQTTCPGKNF